MLKPIFVASVIWALLFWDGCGPGVVVDGPEIQGKVQVAVPALTLTNERPSGYFAVGPDILSSTPPVLELSVTKVTNEAETPLDIFVYLSPAGDKDQPEPKKILLGNFSLYPPDRPGKFLLRASTAFRKLGAAGTVSGSTEVRLLIELHRLRETKPWTPVEVAVAPPRWQRGEPE